MNRNRLLLQILTFSIAIITTIISLMVLDARFDDKDGKPEQRFELPFTEEDELESSVSSEEKEVYEGSDTLNDVPQKLEGENN